jgi:uncharacterized protein YhjY with autotransporter beta-barrel domain
VVTVYAENACYGGAGSMNVTINALAPVTAGDATMSAPYNTPTTLSLPVGGSYTSVAIANNGTKGQGVISGTTLTYTGHDYVYGGTDTLTYTVNGEGGPKSGVVTITLGAPAGPSFAPASSTGPYYTRQQINLGLTGVATQATYAQPSNGTFAYSNGVAEFMPGAGFYGTEVVELTLTGPGGTSGPQTLTFTVEKPPINQPIDATWATGYETPVTASIATSRGANLLFNSATIATPPAHGEISRGGPANFVYTPAPGFVGQDQFVVSAVNEIGETASGTITVQVGAPAAPVATGGTINTGYKQPVSFTLPATGAVTGYALSGAATGGAASLSGSTATFVPGDGFTGLGGLDYTVSGPGGVSAIGHFSVNVAAPGAPVVQGASLTTQEGEPVVFSISTSGVLTAIESYAAPAHGSVVVSGSNATYTPEPGFVGGDSFQLVGRGVGADSAPAVFNVNVVPIPPPPPPPPPIVCADGSSVTPPAICPVEPPKPSEELQAKPSEESTPVNTPIAVNLMRLVQGAPVASLAVVEQAQKGVVEVEQGEALYTPEPDFVGTDRFKYRAVSSSGAAAEAVVTVVVEKGALPVVRDVRIEVVAGVPFTVDLAQAAEGGPFEGADIVDAPSAGDATTSGTNLTFTAPAEFSGEARMTFLVRNKWGPSEPANLVASVLAAAVPSKDLKATVLQGKEVRIDLTEGALGGPFVAASLAAFDPQIANARIEQEGDRFFLVFSSKGQFTGLTRVGFTLTNSRTVSAVAFVTLDVQERENPTLNRDVAGFIAAQTATASRFGDSQVSNVMRRLEGLHNGRRESGLSVAFPLTRDLVSRDEEAGRDFTAQLDRALGRGHDPISAGEPARQTTTSGVSVWAGGAIDFGNSRGAQRRSKSKFTTGGLSAGVDAPIGEKIVLGAGAGFGKDETKIGDKGTKSSASSVSFFGYGSYQPGRATFVDAVLGVNKLDFDSQRYIDATGATVTGSRRGDQVFGAISAGWEHQGPRLMVSPYGRLQFVWTNLNGFTEQGDGTYALAFLGQRASDVVGALGVRGQLRYELDEGTFLPAFRLEYRQTLHSGGAARMRYADWADSPIWSLQPSGTDDHSLVLGAGSTYRRGEWTFSLEAETTAASKAGQTTRVRASGSTRF